MSESPAEQLKFTSFSFGDLTDKNLAGQLQTGSVLPFSQNRLRSFLNNPRARKEDILLITCTLNDQIIGYRTMLPDELISGLNIVRFAWLSGIWVSPSHRKKGIGKKLHELAWESWSGHLIGTEFTAANGKVMLKTDHYRATYSKSGIIIYYRSPVSNIVGKRYPFLQNFKFLFTAIDGLLDTWGKIRNLTAHTIPLPIHASMSLCDHLSEEARKFIGDYGIYSITNRRLAELDWIITYPWISGDLTAKAESKHYYFSVYAENFSLKLLEIRLKGTLTGIAMISIRDGVMKIPYLFINNEKTEIAASCILIYASENRIKKLISYHTLLNYELIRQDQKRIYFKNTNRKYLISKKFIENGISDVLKFEDGDGDCVFV